MDKVFKIVFQSIQKYLLKLKIKDLDDATKSDIENLCKSFEEQRYNLMYNKIEALLQAKSDYYYNCEKYVQKKLKNKTQEDIENAFKVTICHLNEIRHRIGQFLDSIRVTVIQDKLNELDENHKVEIHNRSSFNFRR